MKIKLMTLLRGNSLLPPSKPKYTHACRCDDADKDTTKCVHCEKNIPRASENGAKTRIQTNEK